MGGVVSRGCRTPSALRTVRTLRTEGHARRACLSATLTAAAAEQRRDATSSPCAAAERLEGAGAMVDELFCGPATFCLSSPL